ncbi:hypothetical protein [Streptomyces sp. NPDC058891]|uniref:hypothetical protein n=1 Tax=Streptomyces sp. NPDC058891 TaxID=3346667 RepID=UPI0036A6F0BD
MIEPAKIPQFTGNLPELELDCGGLNKNAGQIRSTGQEVHKEFQGLSAYYKAPEAEQLFATTRPVADRADGFASDLEKVSAALSTYASEVRPLVEKLKHLKADATQFINSVQHDEGWEHDGDKVERHNQIQDDVTATVAAFWAAERTCHNKITAIFGGVQLVAANGSHQKNQYGLSAADLKHSKVPWGEPVEQKHHWYDIGHWAKSFVWDGIVVDGVWGTIQGMGSLVGVNGWAAMGQAWKGLALLGTGATISTIPGLREAFFTLPSNKLPSWLRDSRKAMVETGKGLLAWDEWGKNPARAAGAVTFNVLTTVFTAGEGAGAVGAGKAGALAKAAALAGKAGRIIDPMTYVGKAAGMGLSKVGDIAKALKGAGHVEIPKLPDDAFTLPKGGLKLPDGTVHLPEGSVVPKGAVKLPSGHFRLPHDGPVLPEGTTKLPTEAGAPAQYIDPKGNILDRKGNVLQHADDAPREPGGDDLNPPAGSDVPHTPSPVKGPALVGADAHAAERAGLHVRLGSGMGHDLGVGRTGGTAATHTGGRHIPTVHADDGGLSGGHLGDHRPGGGADHLPGGSAHEHGGGPSASHEPPSGSNDHNDGPGGPHDAETAGGGDGPGGDGPGGDGPGGDGPNTPGAGGVHHEAAWHAPEDSGPLERGGELERQVREQIRGTDVKQGDVPKILDTLANSPSGKEVADTIASGRFKDAEGFSNLVSNISRPEDFSGCLEQVRLANRLHESGITDISFEIKQGGHEIKPGVFTGPHTDLDVMARDVDGRIHGWQFKDMTGERSPTEPSKAASNMFKKISQLTESNADMQTLVVDTKIPRSEMATQIARLQRGYDSMHVQFVVRSPDGIIFVPPGGKFTPEGVL